MNLVELNIIATSQPKLKQARKNKANSIRKLRNIYAITLFVLIVTSFTSLLFSQSIQREYKGLFFVIEFTIFLFLLFDYILRWITSPIRSKLKSKSLFTFPFSMISILLIASIIPSFYVIGNFLDKNNKAIPIFTEMQDFKFLRMIRIALLANLFPPLAIFKRVIEKNKWILYNVFFIVIITITIFSLIILNAERDVPGSKITTFLDSLYFSTVTLTTIGFGDLTPKSDIGKIIVIIMSIIGIGILAIPSGIIAGGFLTEARLISEEKKVMIEKSKKKK